MSVLENIRSRKGLLIGIVGVALVIFILEGLLGSGASLFRSNDNSVGTIAGDQIDAMEFQRRVQEQETNIAMQNQNNPDFRIDENTHQQIVSSIWDQFINEKVIEVQYKKLGITVSDEELVDLMRVHPHPYIVQQFTDRNTGAVYPDFATPQGTLDLVKFNRFIDAMTPEQEKSWKGLEDAIVKIRTSEKYNSLIKKAMYTTQAEAKDAFVAQAKQMNVSFAIKRYNTLSDSAVKVTDEDLQAYYNKHKNDYKVDEPSRKFEYVSFDVMPSAEDFVALQKDAQRIADEFKTRSGADDSSYVAQESENNVMNIGTFDKKSMPIADSAALVSPKGTVFGPYTEGAFLKVYKILDVKSVADSAKVRHILIGFQNARTKGQRAPQAAKREADSLVTLIKEKKTTFDTLVKTISDDMGSVDKGGDYGWFGESAQFVAPYKYAGLSGTKGNITVVETQFGYHIIEVLDVAKSRHNSYTVASIDKLIAPSAATSKEYFKKASDFAGKNNTAEAFAKAIDAEKLNKRISNDIRESERNLPGMANAKDLVRWLYAGKKGDISGVFEFKDRFVVAHIAGVKEMGIAPLDEVKEDVTLKVTRDKKAEKFLEEFKAKGGSTVDDIAAKNGLTVETMDGLNFASYNVAGIGPENVLIGTAAGLKQGATSKATAGDNGVFVVKVNTINEAPLPKDYKNKQKEMEQMATGNLDYMILNVLKEKAGVEDHRGRFDL